MTQLDWNVLDLDHEQEATRIAVRLREILSRTLHRRGLVVAISGGIDSSACLGLAVRALGRDEWEVAATFEGPADGYRRRELALPLGPR